MNVMQQRRVAGFAALLLLMAVVPFVALPAVGGEGNPPDVECGVENPIYAKYQYSNGDLTRDGGSADVDAWISDGRVFWDNNEESLLIYRIVFKTGLGNDGIDDSYQIEDPLQTGSVLIPDALSHVTFCLEDAPDEPDLASANVSGACNEQDNKFYVTVTATNATVDVDLNGDGDYGDPGEQNLIGGTYEVTASAGDSVDWVATADEGAEFEGDAPEGSITVLDCSEPEPDLASANVSGACNEQDNKFYVTVTATNATVDVDLNGDGDYGDPGEQNLIGGTYEVTASAGDSVDWVATADEGAEFEGDAPEGSITVADCSQPPPPPPPPPPPGDASASVSGVCVTDTAGNGSATLAVTVSNATVSIVGVGTFTTSQTITGLAEGSTFTWAASAAGNNVLTTPSSGSATVGTCTVAVAGIQVTTTTVEVAAETLPFTGFEAQDAALMGLMVLAGGGLLLLAANRREEDEATVTESFHGWSR